MNPMDIIKRKGGLVLTIKPGTLIEVGEGKDKVYMHFYTYKGTFRLRVISDTRVPITRHHEELTRNKRLVNALGKDELFK